MNPSPSEYLMRLVIIALLVLLCSISFLFVCVYAPNFVLNNWVEVKWYTLILSCAYQVWYACPYLRAGTP